MWDALLCAIKDELPSEVSSAADHYFSLIENGDFKQLLDSVDANTLCGLLGQSQELDSWSRLIDQALESSTESGQITSLRYFLIAYTALLCFLQASYTGPPLSFSPSEQLSILLGGAGEVATLQRQEEFRQALAVDGIAAYRLLAHPELLTLALSVLQHSTINTTIPLSGWARLRCMFTHQRVLSEQSSTLEERIYQDLEAVSATLERSNLDDDLKADFELERAAIETHYNNDRAARSAISAAAKFRQLEFALTGRLGKRTKFQQRDISQLVVLARSKESGRTNVGVHNSKVLNGPTTLDLNDDTLLESISFSDRSADQAIPLAQIVDEAALPAGLADLDPSNQPLLDPRDGVTLLALASAITNTSPADGLTREETLPYATRVLDGGSSNWQVYTQALLVRSRIEGFKSRTVERGLLQLQAVVDQVILDTTSKHNDKDGESTATTFLPHASTKESAPCQERLRFVFQLASPARWDLEAELAQRWVSLGGLRSALEIYERLEMWAEAALCWAATDQEDKARQVIRKLLYESVDDSGSGGDKQSASGQLKTPLPADAPRLFCILGDIDQDPAMYEKAWEVSGKQYARAQRSLGRLYYTKKDYLRAASAYSRSLHVNRLNHASWFAFGCALLELEEHTKAAEAFTRCIQLDEQDAEAWSNLAAALLRRDKDPARKELFTEGVAEASDTDGNAGPQNRRADALKALKRAAAIKHDSYQIWENVLVVAASLDPPEVVSIMSAQARVLELRGKVVGEQCIDFEVMALVVREIITENDHDSARAGPPRMLVELFDKKIQPVITASAALWGLVAKLAMWRKRPGTALEAHEKAWRCVTTQPGWETESEARWNDVVDATIEICDAYESIGPMQVTEGLGAGQDAVVAKDWKFKARSAVRGIMGRGRDSWEDTEGWSRLTGALKGLRG